jgi:hypothetical protein
MVCTLTVDMDWVVASCQDGASTSGDMTHNSITEKTLSLMEAIIIDNLLVADEFTTIAVIGNTRRDLGYDFAVLMRN